MANWRHIGIVVVVAVGLAPGCGFHRTKMNEQVRDLDVSQIVPGETTWYEVFDVLGAPSSIETLDYITTGGMSRRNFNYTYSEEKTVRFTFLPYMIIFPSFWADRQQHRRILIELDDDLGVVNSIVVTSRMSVWPMWGDMTNDQPLHVDYDDGSGS